MEHMLRWKRWDILWILPKCAKIFSKILAYFLKTKKWTFIWKTFYMSRSKTFPMLYHFIYGYNANMLLLFIFRRHILHQMFHVHFLCSLKNNCTEHFEEQASRKHLLWSLLYINLFDCNFQITKYQRHFLNYFL